MVSANREGQFLIRFLTLAVGHFPTCGILALQVRVVGAIGKTGHSRTQCPFSAFRRAVVGLLLRRRPLYPAELRDHVPETLILQGFQGSLGLLDRGEKLDGSALAVLAMRSVRLSSDLYRPPFVSSLAAVQRGDKAADSTW